MKIKIHGSIAKKQGGIDAHKQEQEAQIKLRNKPQLTENMEKNTQEIKLGAEVDLKLTAIFFRISNAIFFITMKKESYNLYIQTCLHYFIFSLKADPLLSVMIIFTTKILSLFFCIRAIKQHYTSSSIITDI